MNKIINRITYFTLIILTVISFYVAYKTEVTDKNPLWESLKFFTLIPALVAIILSFLTKNILLSLFFGIFSGSLIVSFANIKGNIFQIIGSAFENVISTIINSMADPWNAGILLQVMAIGGLIALVSRMGGTYAIANLLSKKAKSARSSQFITWILGLLVFFDDYANSLIVGPIMRPVTDKQKISREKLAFIVDATAAPIAGIALVSTWIGYELSLIKSELNGLPVKTSAYSLFIDTIPYRFYNIFILCFIVITIILLKEFGPMLKAEKRARTKGKVIDENSTPLEIDEKMNIKPETFENKHILNAIIPISTLIITALVGFYINGYSVLEGDILKKVNEAPFSLYAIREAYSNSDASVVLFMSAVLAGIVAMIIGLSQKIFDTKEAIDTWIEGWKSMIITVVILLFAWSIADIIKNQLNADDFLAIALGNTIPAFIIPSVIFLLASIISFATGTSYGTMGILMPLAIPLANTASNGDMNLVIASIGAVLTGAIFGDHCSPISDTTILSSMGTSCDHIDHVKTQLPYSILIAVVSILVGFLPAGLGISPLITLPIGIGVLFGIMLLFGKKPLKN
jgi:Na+/H+ antiporter NhaC